MPVLETKEVLSALKKMPVQYEHGPLQGSIFWTRLRRLPDLGRSFLYGRHMDRTLGVTGAPEADGLAGSEAVALLDAAEVAFVAAQRRGALQEALVAAYNLSHWTRGRMVNYSIVYCKRA